MLPDVSYCAIPSQQMNDLEMKRLLSFWENCPEQK